MKSASDQADENGGKILNPSGQFKKRILTWGPFLVFFSLFLILSVIAYKQILNRQKPTVIAPDMPQLPTLTPTPIRAESPIATLSAFIQLDREIKTFSRDLSSQSLTDQSIEPPSVILPLDITL